MATSPLPSRGSPPLQSGGQNQKWPTCGHSGYVTPAVSGIPTAAERGGKSEVAHKWAKWLRHPCHLGDPHRSRAGGGGGQKWPTYGQSGYVTPAVSGILTAAERGAKSEVAHKWAKWLRNPCRLGDPHRCRAGGKIRSGPQVGKVATSPLPSRGSPPLQSGGGGIRSGPQMGKVATSPLPSRGSPPLQSGVQNQKWPTNGQSGYVTPAVSGIPTAPERGAKSEVAHKWAKWLRHPCRLGDPHRSRAGGGNQKWPTSGQSGYVTPAVSGIPTAPERGGKSEVAHKWAKWLRHPCRLGDPHRFRAGCKIRSGPQVGKVATSPLPSRGSPPLQSRGGGGSEVAHLWAKWLRHPCRLGDPHRCRAGGGNQKWPTSGQSGYVTPAVSGIPTAAERGGEIRSGPQVGKVATSPLPSRGSPPLQSGGQNQKWPTNGQSGYVTPAVSGIPTAPERGAKSEVAHKWAKWLRHPCRLGDPHRFRAGCKIRSGPQVGKVATSPLPSRGSPPLQSRGGGGFRSGPLMGKVATSPLPSRGSPPLQSRGGGNQKWPTNGQSGYVTPAVSGIPTAPERGGGNQKWPTYGQSGYVTPAVSGIPTAPERGGGGIRSGPQMGKVATSPLPSRGSPPLQSGGQNQKWPTSGQSGYVTPAVSGIPTAAERGGKSEVAHKWAKWLRHPCRLGDPHRFRAGGKIRSGPQVGKVATSPLPSRGSPPLQSRGGGGQKWPTCGQGGYVTRAVSGIPTTSKRGAKSEVVPKRGRNCCVTPAVSAIPKKGG